MSSARFAAPVGGRTRHAPRQWLGCTGAVEAFCSDGHWTQRGTYLISEPPAVKVPLCNGLLNRCIPRRVHLCELGRERAATESGLMWFARGLLGATGRGQGASAEGARLESDSGEPVTERYRNTSSGSGHVGRGEDLDGGGKDETGQRSGCTGSTLRPRHRPRDARPSAG